MPHTMTPSSQHSDVTANDAELTDRFREIGMLTRALLDAEGALKAEREEHVATVEQLLAERDEALAQARQNYTLYEEVLNSSSWRLTAPLRKLSARLSRSKQG